MEERTTEPGATERGTGRDARARWAVWAAVAAGVVCLVGAGVWMTRRGAEAEGVTAVGVVAGALALVYGVSWGVRRAGETSDERRVTSDGREVGGKETAGGTPASPERGPEEEMGKDLETIPAGAAPGRVLVVDDMAVNRLALGGLLERAGVGEVRQAGNGAEALDGMREWVPDLVFTDMWMPIMDGQELAEAMRKDARLAGVPVVAVTADDEAGETYSLKAFAAVVVKPVTGAKLVGAFGAARTKGRAR